MPVAAPTASIVVPIATINSTKNPMICPDPFYFKNGTESPVSSFSAVDASVFAPSWWKCVGAC